MIRRSGSRYLSPNALLFGALATIWGLSFVAIEAGLEAVPPLFFAGARYALAGVLVLGYAAVTRERIRPRGRTEWLNVAVVGGFLVAAYHALLYLGQTAVPGSVAAVIVSLSPVLTAVFAALVLDDSLDAVTAGGFLLGLVGVAIVADLDPANLLGADVLGIGLLLVAAASFALGSVLSTPLRTTLADVSMQGWAMLVGSLALLAGSVATGESPADVAWTPTALAALAYLTVASGVIGFLLYFALHARIGPSETNLVGYFQPVVAALGGWALLGQAVSGTTVLGFLGIFAGFALVQHRTIHHRLGGRMGRVGFHPDSLRHRLVRRLPRSLGCGVNRIFGLQYQCRSASVVAEFGHDAD
ncbi:DMT family transporter [Halobellus rubicundus]|uniref:DMT family transporter n=1 Tax=Halobellus rubicundus TaxID=2996466 RepID=A0ABD5M9I6_9EURY